MFKLVTQKVHPTDDWSLRIDRHNGDGTVDQVAHFRDSEKKLALAVIAFLNATATVSLYD